MKSIVFTHPAAREFDALLAEQRAAVGAALVDYATSGRRDVKRLQGRDGFRLRIGRYRVLFDEDRTSILSV